MKTTRTGLHAAAVFCLLALAPLAAHAATITIVNLDAAGEGFNDPTAAAPVGGNNGVTVGQQRLNVFNQAAAIWGGLLPSTVTIVVQSQFNALTCTATSGTLGSAGPRTVHSGFANQPVAAHWYHQALANKLSGVDNDPATNDIQAIFNSNVGTPGCLDTAPWYYGFDHAQGIGLDLLAVVLHELGHGLGFSTTTSASTGVFLGTAPNQFPSVFDKFLLDISAGLHWDQMSNAQRVASAINTNNLVWDGPVTTSKAPTLLQQPRLLVNSPPVIAASYPAGTADFGTELTSGGVAGNMVLATDGAGATNDGCEAFTNAGAIAGNIALVDRGTCPFAQKATNAFAAGASALVIANNQAGLIDMTGSAPGVTIPVIMIQQGDGNLIKAQIGGGVNATVGLDPGVHPGTNGGKVVMYAPNPVQPGSSVSHFDISLQPNALMEPAISGDLTDDVDLTRYAFQDLGWVFGNTDSPPPAAGPAIALRGAPNPFRGATSLRINLPAAGMVELTVLDIGGRSVRNLARSWMPAGQHLIPWDGTDGEGHSLPSGVYLTRLKAGGASVTQRIVRME
jgi:hypothetical protein